MMGLQTQVIGGAPVWETVRQDSLKSLRKAFRHRPLVAGAVGYPPFVQNNGESVQGPLVDYLRHVAGEFGTSLDIVQCTWLELPEKLLNSHIDTVCDPVLLSRARPFDLVPYITVETPQILFQRKNAATLKEPLGRIAQLARAPRDRTQFRAIRKAVHEIQSRANGFAATAGTMEEDVVSQFNISVHSMPVPDIVANGIEALFQNYMYCADRPSAEAILAEAKKNRIYYEKAHLLGDDSRTHVYAGFALAPMDEDLQWFFLSEVKLEDSALRAQLAHISNKDISEVGIAVLRPESIPPEPLVAPRLFGEWESPGPYEGQGLLQQGDATLLIKGATEDAHIVSDLGAGRHRYPLRQGIDLGFDGSRVVFAGFEGRGQTRDEAINHLRSQLHRRFQSLRRIAPHERSPEEEAAWRTLVSIIDIERYEEANRSDEPVLGHVLQVSDDCVTLELITEPEGPVDCRFDDLPPEAAAARVDDWFEARIRRVEDRIEWGTWRWREPLSSDTSVWDAFQDPGKAADQE